MSTFVALRYLTSGRRNRFFSWIATLSILGISIGVATMIVVLSVINGFETELRNRFLNANAHILMFRYPDGLKDPDRWIKRIQNDFKDEVTGASAFVHYETMIKKDAVMHSVLVRGFNPEFREKVQSLRPWIEPKSSIDEIQKQIDHPSQRDPIPPIIVGEGVLSILNAQVGDTISMISPRADNFTKLKQFRIVGVYHSGLKHYDNRLIAMALPSAQEFFGMGRLVTGLEIGLRNPDASPEIARRMLQTYPLSVKEWQSFNRPLLEALNMERAVIFIIVCLVAVVAGFNILTTLFVAVTQKQREISLLKALGAENLQIIALFLKQGLMFGIIGAFLGCILAVIISYIIETYQFIDLPDPYYLTTLPVEYDWRLYLILSGFGILICVLAGVFPALAAMRVSPTEGLRGTGKALTGR